MLTAPGVGYRPRMSVFMDTTTGMGLAGATGVRPYLPPLLAGALARGDTGIDFALSGNTPPPAEMSAAS